VYVRIYDPEKARLQDSTSCIEFSPYPTPSDVYTISLFQIPGLGHVGSFIRCGRAQTRELRGCAYGSSRSSSSKQRLPSIARWATSYALLGGHLHAGHQSHHAVPCVVALDMHSGEEPEEIVFLSGIAVGMIRRRRADQFSTIFGTP
jgi:hypothetical protein